MLLVGWLAVPASAQAPQRNLTKTRPNSTLKKDKLWDEPADLRGSFERRRDAELVTHFQRLAELDYIAELAREAKDGALEEAAEDVRRKEVQRHQRVMMRIVREARAAQLGARP